MFDFYSPLIQRAEGRPIGLWPPEAAYPHETMDSFRESARQASVELDAIGDSIQSAYLLADARQFAHPPKSGEAWARVNSTERLLAIARDHPLSGNFAFGATTGSEFVASVRSRGNGSLLVANDLESLLANPMQAERFESIVHSLREGGVHVVPPIPPGNAPVFALVDNSSWSDYDDTLSRGITSDTRWTGLRRSDGLVVSRIHRDQPISQLWKHAFTLATERVETAIRRDALHLLQSVGATRRPHVLRRLAVAYGRHWFRDHYRAQGVSTNATDFGRSTEAAWYSSLESEVPERSPADVMKRATMFALAPAGEWPGGDPLLSVEETVADTGHIAGEAHGEWKNPRWCEHGPG